MITRGARGGRDTIQEMHSVPRVYLSAQPLPTKLETRSYFHTNCNTRGRILAFWSAPRA